MLARTEQRAVDSDPVPGCPGTGYVSAEDGYCFDAGVHRRPPYPALRALKTPLCYEFYAATLGTAETTKNLSNTAASCDMTMSQCTPLRPPFHLAVERSTTKSTIQ